MRQCSQCTLEIPDDAARCPHCTHIFSAAEMEDAAWLRMVRAFGIVALIALALLLWRCAG